MDFYKFFLNDQIEILTDVKYIISKNLVDLYQYQTVQLPECLTKDYLCPISLTYIDRVYYNSWFVVAYMINEEKVKYLRYNYCYNDEICEIRIDCNRYHLICDDNKNWLFKSPLLKIKCY